jgi:hypothetical protein
LLDDPALDFIEVAYQLLQNRSSRTIIPNHKMATPFCAFKTLTGFGFQFTEVLPHFCELV